MGGRGEYKTLERDKCVAELRCFHQDLLDSTDQIMPLSHGAQSDIPQATSNYRNANRLTSQSLNKTHDPMWQTSPVSWVITEDPRIHCVLSARVAGRSSTGTRAARV